MYKKTEGGGGGGQDQFYVSQPPTQPTGPIMWQRQHNCYLSLYHVTDHELWNVHACKMATTKMFYHLTLLYLDVLA